MSAASDAEPRSELEREVERRTWGAETPNGTISARSNGGENWYDVTITFHNGQARRAGDAKVENDIAQLGRLMFAQWTAHWRRALHASGTDNPVEMNDRRRAWAAERDALMVEGVSDDGSIRMRCIGMANWSAELERGTCDRLSDAELGAALTQAAKQLTDTWADEVKALNRKHFFGKGS